MAETSNSRLARLLTLIPWLTAHSGVSKAVAAAHFDISVAQLEADLELVTFTGPGLYGGELVDIYFDDETITVYDSQGLDRPLHMTGDEVSALLLGLRALQQLPDIDTQAVASAITKLSGEAIASELAVDLQPAEVASLVAQAIKTKRKLQIEYLHPLRDDSTRRTIAPLALFTSDGADYVHAWCELAQAHRTFRLDRMQRCEIGEAQSDIPDEPVAHEPREVADVDVEPWAQHVLEGVPARVIAADRTIHAEIEYSDERWLVQWLVAAGSGVTVRSPAAAQETARRRAEAALLAYGAV